MDWDMEGLASFEKCRVSTLADLPMLKLTKLTYFAKRKFSLINLVCNFVL